MSVLVLSEHDVRTLLDMESCIAAMEDVLARLARDELINPLRTVMRSPGPALGLGLMPAYAGGSAPVFSLKEIVVAPSNSEIGLDPHQGSVLLHDGETGQLTAILNASPITEIRTAAVSAVATKQLARRNARTVAVLGSGVQGRSHVEAMQTVLDDPIVRIWSRRPEHAEALALETHSLVAPQHRGGRRRSGRRLHDDCRPRADPATWSACTGHPRERRRRLRAGRP